MIFVFYFNSYSIIRTYPNIIDGQQNIGDEQVWDVLGRYNLDYTKLSASLLSYLLNYKFVYFVFDGVDNEEDCENIITNINRYINRYHSKNKKLKVLISTRIKDFQFQELLINNLKLHTLTKSEIKDFFFKKTEELQMNLNQHPDFGQIIDSELSVLSFNNRLTQTPLFAEVVLIILKTKGIENLIKEFHQSIASIYKLFIKILYERSANGSNEYGQFFVLYRNLAFKTWRSGNSFDIQDIISIFGNSSFDAQFMVKNGLLVQNDKATNEYSFIHQTIPDVLAIEALTLNQNFFVLQDVDKLGEDLQTYLKDEIQNTMQYAALLITNPGIAVSLLERLFFNKISKNELASATRIIVRSCIEYVVNHPNIKNLDCEYILRIFRKLSEWQSQLYQILCDEVEIYPKTKDILSIFLSLQIETINKYIINLILLNVSKDILTGLLANNQYLIRIIDPYFLKPPINSDDSTIILFALEADIINQQNSYKIRFVESLGMRSDQEIIYFLEKEKIRKDVFFKEYTNQVTTTTQRLNKLLAIVGITEIFIPKGTYSIANKVIENHRSITASRQPYQKTFKEDNLNNAILKMQNEVLFFMWTFEQFKIAYAYFEGTSNNNFNGFLGLNSFNNIKYEAVKDNNIYRVNFAYFENNSKNTNVITSNQSNKEFNQTILYRSIQQY